MQEKIYIYNNGNLIHTVDKVMSATCRETLDGERTLSFTTLVSRALNISTSCIVMFENQYYNVVMIRKSLSGGQMIVTASCEHVSYILNDQSYTLDSFEFKGTPTDALSELLSDTPFTVGTVDFTEEVDVYLPSRITRRAALMQLVGICGGEIEYDGYAIGIRSHRGSSILKELNAEHNLSNISVTYDNRSETESYELELWKLVKLSVGDDVKIAFSPLCINVNTRIVSLEYDPFHRRRIRVGVGSYLPDIIGTVRKSESVTSKIKEHNDGTVYFNGKFIGGGKSVKLFVGPDEPTEAAISDAWVDIDDYTRYDCKSVSEDTVLSVDDCEVILASGEITITLHSTQTAGIIKKIYNTGENDITIVGTINGTENLLLKADEGVDLITDGTGWRAITGLCERGLTRLTYTAVINDVWTGETAPYTQEVEVIGILDTDMPHITPVYSMDNETAVLEETAWSLISKAEAGTDNITFTCFSEAPAQQINIHVEVFR